MARLGPKSSAAAVLVCVLIAAALAGCGKDKTTNPIPQPFTYPLLDTPQNVVLNVKYAWERKDSVRTRLIYDNAYQGQSTDESGTLNFTKDQEVEVVWNIARNQNVSRVSFEYNPPSTWIRLSYPPDPPGWTAIQLQGVNIQVDDAVQGTLIASASNFFEFKFVPTLDSASPTDTTWKIIRWTEIRN